MVITVETVTVLPILSAPSEVVGFFLINKFAGQNQFFEGHETVIVECLLGISLQVFQTEIFSQSGHSAHISTFLSLLFHLQI